MDADRREWSLEVQRGLLVRCDELHRSAKLVRFTAGLTQQDAAEVRTHSAEVRAAVALARSQRGTPVVHARSGLA